MNERFLCRGKKNDGTGWAIGLLIEEGKIAFDAGMNDVPHHVRAFTSKMAFSNVDPATVGQCTGLRDKNGVLVFEGDILKDEIGAGEVKWLAEHCQFVCRTIEPHEYHSFASDGTLVHSEIIGNIHDNPELIGAFL